MENDVSNIPPAGIRKAVFFEALGMIIGGADKGKKCICLITIFLLSATSTLSTCFINKECFDAMPFIGLLSGASFMAFTIIVTTDLFRKSHSRLQSEMIYTAAFFILTQLLFSFISFTCKFININNTLSNAVAMFTVTWIVSTDIDLIIRITTIRATNHTPRKENKRNLINKI